MALTSSCRSVAKIAPVFAEGLLQQPGREVGLLGEQVRGLLGEGDPGWEILDRLAIQQPLLPGVGPEADDRAAFPMSEDASR